MKTKTKKDCLECKGAGLIHENKCVECDGSEADELVCKIYSILGKG